MAFRRDKQAALEKRRWEDFIDANRRLFEQSGIPQAVYQSQEWFDDFLMHGYIDHHPYPTDFTVDSLNPRETATLKQIVLAYIKAGFDDPGMVLFHNDNDVKHEASNARGDWKVFN